MLLLNLLLALAWLLLTGQFTPANFGFGFGLTYLLLWFFQRAIGADQQSAQRAAYFRRVGLIMRFGLFFVKELILANVRVARDVLRFRPQMQPAVVTLPLKGFSDAEVTMLANFITLTPGTLSLMAMMATVCCRFMPCMPAAANRLSTTSRMSFMNSMRAAYRR
jgi:multicomponent Na+:H+ antiporter subunit E